MYRENLKIVGGVADLEWKRRRAAKSYGERWNATELDWIWVRCWFEYGLEENKLESGADDLDWMRRSVSDLRLWVRRALRVLWVRRRCGINCLIWGFCLERQTEQWANKVERQRSKRETGEKAEKRDGCFNFLFIYKTGLTGNQKPLKLHQRSRSKSE